MRPLICSRPSPALILACLALLIALGGTSSAATQLPKNSVGSEQLKKNAVTTAKLRNAAVTSAKVKDGALLAKDFAPGVLTGPRAGPAGPSDAYSKSLNGPIAVPVASPDQPATLTSLRIPQAGKYVIWGKAFFTTAARASVVNCFLLMGADSSGEIDQSTTGVAKTSPSTLALNVVHKYAGAGTVDFSCSATAAAKANFIKITAIKVGN